MSLNKVMLIGNMGKDPEVKYVSPDVAVATLVLATTNRANERKDGTRVPETAEWHTVILWRGLAKTAEQYIRKGDKVYVEGELHTRSYTDRNGQTHSRAEIWAEKLEIFNFHNQAAPAKE
jgi:single-strand DNA-binding protein